MFHVEPVHRNQSMFTPENLILVSFWGGGAGVSPVRSLNTHRPDGEAPHGRNRTLLVPKILP